MMNRMRRINADNNNNQILGRVKGCFSPGSAPHIVNCLIQPFTAKNNQILIVKSSPAQGGGVLWYNKDRGAQAGVQNVNLHKFWLENRPNK